MLVEDCDIRTGDDCIAGFDNEGLTVRRCRLNSACSDFRIGGHGILVDAVWLDCIKLSRVPEEAR